MDPITITACVSGATAALNTVKQMISAGRDLESCIGDVSRWMKMASDVDQAVKQTKTHLCLKSYWRLGLSRRRLYTPMQPRKSWNLKGKN